MPSPGEYCPGLLTSISMQASNRWSYYQGSHPTQWWMGTQRIDSDRGSHFPTLMYRTELKLCSLQPSGSELGYFFLNRVTQHFKSLGTGSTLNEWNQILPRAINMPNENPSIRNWLPSYELLARDAPDVSQTLERLLSPWLVAFQILTVKPCYWRHHMLWFQSMENKAGSELEAPSWVVSLHRVTQCIQTA